MNDFLKFLAVNRVVFLWGILVLLLGLRLYFYKGENLPTNVNLTFEGTIKNDVKTTEGGQQITFANLKIYVPMYPSYQYGDRLNVSGFVSERGVMSNPKVAVVGKTNSFEVFLHDLRAKMLEGIEKLMPQNEASLVSGSVLGTDRLGADFKSQLVKTGTIHVVVVSGQNLAIVVGFIMAFSKYIGRRKTAAAAVLFAVLYALFTGFAIPVIRGLIMVGFSFGALLYGRMSSALMSLFAAAAVIILIWPESISSISFQLTFAASLGIMTMGKILEDKLSFLPVAGQNAAVSLSAFLFTAPIIVFYFGRISFLSPLVNILVLEAVTPLMLLGFLMSAATLLFMPLARILAVFAFVPAKYFSYVVIEFSKIDAGYFDWMVNEWTVAIYYAAILLITFIWTKRQVQS